MAENAFWKYLNDRKDHELFLACFGIGCVGVIALKLIGAHQFLVTAFASLVLIVYGLYVWRTKRYQLRGDRAGDSVYYLGFLFTLLSLGISLFQFVAVGMQAREIVGNLGIALMTTMLGLGGRVILTQMREDPVEIEESARLALAEAASQVRSELSHMVEDVQVFRTSTMQAITEGAEAMARETNKALAENVTQFTASARSVIERIEQVFGEFGENAKKVNRVSANTAIALEKLIARVEAIDAPQTLITAKFDPLADRLAEVLTAFSSRLAEQQTAVDSLRQSVDAAIGQANQTVQAMAPTAAAISKIAQDLERQAAATTGSADSMRAISEAVGASLSNAAEQQVRQTTETQVALRDLAATAGKAMGDLADSQADASGRLVAAIAGAIESVEEAVASIKASTGDMSEQTASRVDALVRAAEGRLASLSGSSPSPQQNSVEAPSIA